MSFVLVQKACCSFAVGSQIPLRSFAYYTIRDRLPVILTKVVDTVYTYRIKAAQQYGEVGVKDIIWSSKDYLRFSELRQIRKTKKFTEVLLLTFCHFVILLQRTQNISGTVTGKMKGLNC